MQRYSVSSVRLSMYYVASVAPEAFSDSIFNQLHAYSQTWARNC